MKAKIKTAIERLVMAIASKVCGGRAVICGRSKITSASDDGSMIVVVDGRNIEWLDCIYVEHVSIGFGVICSKDNYYRAVMAASINDANLNAKGE